MRKPYTHFDLPTYHLSGEHYVPARARSRDETERRRQQPAGTLLLEQQAGGLAIASAIINEIEDDEDLRFAGDMLAASGLNASWFGFGQNAPVMRRRLFLPELANDETDMRETREGLLEKTRQQLALTAVSAAEATSSHRDRRLTPRHVIDLSRSMGTVSLGLATIHIGDAPETVSAFHMQDAVRRNSIVALDRARTSAAEIGINPSIAQLVDSDSHVSVHWRRSAPNGARNALIKAQEETAA